MTELIAITADNWRRAVGVRVPDGQLPFVAAHQPVALVILSKAFVRVGGVDWWPYLVEDEGRAVGVLALTDERAAHRALGILHLVIDERQQGRGHGRAALRRAIALAASTDGVDRLRLTVHPDNAAALALYRSEGFVADGHDDDGELRMNRPVDAAPPVGGSGAD